MTEFQQGVLIGIIIGVLLLPQLQRFALWLVWDSGISLGKYAPYVFGFAIGRFGTKVEDDTEG